MYLQQLTVELLAKDCHHPLPQAAPFEFGYECSSMSKRERNIGINQSHALILLHDIVHLRLIGLEELTACGYIIKQIAHLEIGPHRTRAHFLRYHLRTVDAK